MQIRRCEPAYIKENQIIFFYLLYVLFFCERMNKEIENLMNKWINHAYQLIPSLIN